MDSTHHLEVFEYGILLFKKNDINRASDFSKIMHFFIDLNAQSTIDVYKGFKQYNKMKELNGAVFK
eukprot:IDg20285t1